MPNARTAALLVVASTSLALAACALPDGRTQPAAPIPLDQGQLRLTLSSPSLAAGGAAGATLTIRPGVGSTFTPISTPLSRDPAARWTAFVTNVPAGPGRVVEVSVYDASGAPLYDGGAVADIRAGSTSTVSIVLQQLGSPGGPVISNPQVSVGVSVAAVAPGGSARLTARASDPAGRPLGFLWAATCGDFGAPGALDTAWRAPPLPYQRCQLSFTASSPVASTTVQLPVDVLPDPATRSVMGQRLVACWASPDAGAPSITSQVAVDAGAGAAPQALVQTAPGLWQAFPGGHVEPGGVFLPGGYGADGSFYLPGLPQVGPYLLSAAGRDGVPLLVDTAAGDVDLGYDLVGRCGQLEASPGTTATFQLGGLEPWPAAGGDLQVASSEVDAFATLGGAGALAPGATSGALTVAWSGPLLAPQDGLWVAQLAPRLHPGGFVYRAVGRGAQVTPFALLDGGGAAASALLAPAGATGALPVQWSLAAFERHLGDLAPPARVVPGAAPVHRLSVKALPGPSSLAPLPAAGALDLAVLEQPAGGVSVGLASPLEWGRFLPGSWSEWREVRAAVAAGYRAPGGDLLLLVASLDRRDPLPAPAGTILPALSPVRAPLVNGASALVDQAGPVSPTPTFSWTAPAVGAPAAYLLEVLSLEATAAGRTTARPVARYLTGATSASLPPGLLAAGGLYLARITALAGDHLRLSAPLRSPRAGAEASVLTGTFSP